MRRWEANNHHQQRQCCCGNGVAHLCTPTNSDHCCSICVIVPLFFRGGLLHFSSLVHFIYVLLSIHSNHKGQRVHMLSWSITASSVGMVEHIYTYILSIRTGFSILNCNDDHHWDFWLLCMFVNLPSTIIEMWEVLISYKQLWWCHCHLYI